MMNDRFTNTNFTSETVRDRQEVGDDIMRRQDGKWVGESEPKETQGADSASLPKELARLGVTLQRQAEELHRRYPAPEPDPAISAVVAALRDRRRTRWPSVVAAALATIAMGGLWWWGATGNQATDHVGMGARRDVSSTVASRETESISPVALPSPSESSWDEAWALYVSSPELEAVLDLADDEAAPMRVGF